VAARAQRREHACAERAPAPFAQLAFEALPETPARPHGFLALEPREIVVRSRPFGSVRVRYRELGVGPPLLLVHGLMTSGYSWRYLAALLAHRFRCLVPDLVGAGESDKPDVAYRAEALAVFVGELLEALGARGADVVGNSLGGYVCMRLALADPGAMRRLVSIHSPGVPLARLWALRAALAVPGAARLLRALVRRHPERWAHRNVHYYDETLKSREEARQYGAPLATDAGRRAFVRWLAEALDPRDMRAFVRALAAGPFPVPLLLLFARRDPMVPPGVGRRLAALVPAARLEWLDEASHFAHVDRPELVAEHVLRFLA
jgi:pimeloyl-ACP methyl ester carboxylesterase